MDSLPVYASPVCQTPAETSALPPPVGGGGANSSDPQAPTAQSSWLQGGTSALPQTPTSTTTGPMTLAERAQAKRAAKRRAQAAIDEAAQAEDAGTPAPTCALPERQSRMEALGYAAVKKEGVAKIPKLAAPKSRTLHLIVGRPYPRPTSQAYECQHFASVLSLLHSAHPSCARTARATFGNIPDIHPPQPTCPGRVEDCLTTYGYTAPEYAYHSGDGQAYYAITSVDPANDMHEWLEGCHRALVDHNFSISDLLDCGSERLVAPEGVIPPLFMLDKTVYFTDHDPKAPVFLRLAPRHAGSDPFTTLPVPVFPGYLSTLVDLGRLLPSLMYTRASALSPEIPVLVTAIPAEAHSLITSSRCALFDHARAARCHASQTPAPLLVPPCFSRVTSVTQARTDKACLLVATPRYLRVQADMFRSLHSWLPFAVTQVYIFMKMARLGIWADFRDAPSFQAYLEQGAFVLYPTSPAACARQRDPTAQLPAMNNIAYQYVHASHWHIVTQASHTAGDDTHWSAPRATEYAVHNWNVAVRVLELMIRDFPLFHPSVVGSPDGDPPTSVLRMLKVLRRSMRTYHLDNVCAPANLTIAAGRCGLNNVLLPFIQVHQRLSTGTHPCGLIVPMFFFDERTGFAVSAVHCIYLNLPYPFRAVDLVLLLFPFDIHKILGVLQSNQPREALCRWLIDRLSDLKLNPAITNDIRPLLDSAGELTTMQARTGAFGYSGQPTASAWDLDSVAPLLPVQTLRRLLTGPVAAHANCSVENNDASLHIREMLFSDPNLQCRFPQAALPTSTVNSLTAMYHALFALGCVTLTSCRDAVGATSPTAGTPTFDGTPALLDHQLLNLPLTPAGSFVTHVQNDTPTISVTPDVYPYRSSSDLQADTITVSRWLDLCTLLSKGARLVERQEPLLVRAYNWPPSTRTPILRARYSAGDDSDSHPLDPSPRTWARLPIGAAASSVRKPTRTVMQ